MTISSKLKEAILSNRLDQLTLESLAKSTDLVEALNFAATVGNLDAVNHLVDLSEESFLSVMLHDNADEAFHNALRNGHTQVVHRLIELTPNEILLSHMLRSRDYEALVETAESGKVELLKLLMKSLDEVQKSDEPNNKDEMFFAKGRLAFETAAKNGHLNFLKEFVALAHNSTTLEAKIPAAKLAVDSKHLKVFKYLLTELNHFSEQHERMLADTRNKAFLHACGMGDTELMKLLLDSTLSLETKNKMIHGNLDLPFLVAAASDQTDAVKLLITATQDHDLKRAMLARNNHRAAYYAAENGNPLMLSVLLGVAQGFGIDMGSVVSDINRHYDERLSDYRTGAEQYPSAIDYRESSKGRLINSFEPLTNPAIPVFLIAAFGDEVGRSLKHYCTTLDEDLIARLSAHKKQLLDEKKTSEQVANLLLASNLLQNRPSEQLASNPASTSTLVAPSTISQTL